MREGQQTSGYALRLRSAVPLLIFLAVFAYRGPYRAISNGGLNDLLSPYVQSAAWVRGLDPYSTESLYTAWPIDGPPRPNESEFRDASVLVKHGIPTAYPLSCFVLVAPFTLLPWPLVKLVWIFVTTILFFVSIYALIKLLKLESWRRDAFVGAALLLAPFHTGLAVCNLAVTATELGILSLWSAFKGNKILTGVLVSLSIGLKPQIGICFLISLLLRRRWAISLATSSLVLALFGIAITRSSAAQIQWLPSYVSDTQALLIKGNLGDFTSRNPTRFGLVNLQVGLNPILKDRSLTNVCAFLICAILGLWMVAIHVRRRVADEFLLLGGICVLSLLPLYHRFYDASLLIVPAGWLISHVRRRFDSRALGVLLLCAFFLPGGSLLETLRDRSTILTTLAGHVWWDALVMAHSSWVLLVLCLVLLRQMAASNQTWDLPLIDWSLPDKELAQV